MLPDEPQRLPGRRRTGCSIRSPASGSPPWWELPWPAEKASTPFSCSSRAQPPSQLSVRPTRAWKSTRRSAALLYGASPSCPRTEGTRKLKRRQIRSTLEEAAPPPRPPPAHRKPCWRATPPAAPSPPERPLDRPRSLFARPRRAAGGDRAPPRLPGRRSRLRRGPNRGRARSPGRRAWCAGVGRFPALGTAVAGARWSRVFHLNTWLLNLARIFAWVRVEGRENLNGVSGPLLVACNHQGYFDTPVIFMALPWRWRHRLAPTMAPRILRRPLRPPPLRLVRLVHEQPELLPLLPDVQRRAHPHARSRRTADVALHWANWWKRAGVR